MTATPTARFCAHANADGDPARCACTALGPGPHSRAEILAFEAAADNNWPPTRFGPPAAVLGGKNRGICAMRAHADVETSVSVVAKRDPPRVSLRIGPLYITATADEALALANDIADAVAVLRAAYPRGRP